MALTAYLNATRRLLQNPSAPTTLYSDPDLTSYINTARGQLAGESESARFMATLPLSSSTQVYNFSSISLSGSVGLQGVIHIRTAWIQSGGGRVWIRPRSFKWFSLYELNATVPKTGQPSIWSQYAQGVNGSIYVSPIPTQSYTAFLDCVCYPIALVDDSTAEAIPYLWTDAIPYYAAYMALLGAQSQVRTADAERMFQKYTEFVNRARRFVTPDILPGQYEQQVNPVRSNQLGLQKPRGMGMMG